MDFHFQSTTNQILQEAVNYRFSINFYSEKKQTSEKRKSYFRRNSERAWKTIEDQFAEFLNTSGERIRGKLRNIWQNQTSHRNISTKLCFCSK